MGIQRDYRRKIVGTCAGRSAAKFTVLGPIDATSGDKTQNRTLITLLCIGVFGASQFQGIFGASSTTSWNKLLLTHAMPVQMVPIIIRSSAQCWCMVLLL